MPLTDQRLRLQEMFVANRRYDCFGDVLVRIHVQGARCHNNTLVEIKSPITAFCGLNGTGKSTLLQLAAAAYRSPDTDQYSGFHISDFMVVGTLDPTPFTPDARIEYRYWQHDRSEKSTTLSRNAGSRRWSGYQRRPTRSVFFTGVGHYLPKVEQRDFVVQHAGRLQVSATQDVPPNIRDWTAKILACSYDRIVSTSVSYVRSGRQYQGKVICAERYGASYSEAHMGFGEARAQFLITAIESFPEKSLILIEEPETSLHPSAQYVLGQYLTDVVFRKRHQVFLTTHSQALLAALPSDAIVYLRRVQHQITPVRGLSPVQINSLLTDGNSKCLHILVEDNCAATILREIILRIDSEFLRLVEVFVGGDADTIARTVRSLSGLQLSIACVRDADKGPSPRDNIFKLPGSLPPERELFASSAVKDHVMSTYGIVLRDFAATLEGVDHHQWLSRLAGHLNQTESILLGDLARAYARSIPTVEVDSLVQQLKEAIR